MSFYLHDLSLQHRAGRILLESFNLSIITGEIVSLMGPSGCGKSTLLSLIAGHIDPAFTFSGVIILDGCQLNSQPPYQRNVGLLFQDDLLFPHLRVWENLAFALPNTIKGQQRKEMALYTLTDVSLISLADAFPQQISGGQKARISLLRMLLAKPKLALLDEPFSKLDKALRDQFRDWVFEQLRHWQIPTLVVTHDAEDVLHCDRIIHWPKEITHA
ncbi:MULTISPECIES: ATP-binding cassette domain-containing protein [unclassified Vibrio]|uniref:ATP-binding cassette domain-containing protein n=1 Tax=unclassified Vibrio TaxID=2614977 RepID=UPI001483441E|nr:MULTISPECIES: ATP-binding cassette domain-containing protein [unclassified Vibrio]NNN43824.1 ATP-binding cassette domain-containing protein [Vibrio sp. 1-1(7)]NNN71648.1 ATP-binding cassette domain-containing protein [Vibrio sp. 12-2(3-a)]